MLHLRTDEEHENNTLVTKLPDIYFGLKIHKCIICKLIQCNDLHNMQKIIVKYNLLHTQ